MDIISLWAVVIVVPLVISATCETQYSKHISYRGQGLRSIPIDIPKDITSLDLSNNDIRTIGQFAFDGLEKLCSLDFSSNSNMGEISNDTLSSLSSAKLKKLILNKCGIVSIDVGAFVHLPHLEYLDLSGNTDLGLSKAMDSLYGLQKMTHNMTDIILTNVNSHTTTFSDRVVNETKGKYLKNICVDNLDLGYNRITYVDWKFYSSLRHPECLKRFSLAGPQMLYFEWKWWMPIALRRFSHLESIDFSGNDPNMPRHKRDSGSDLNRVTTPRRIHSDTTTNLDIFPHSLEFVNLSGGVIRSTSLNTSIRFINVVNLRVVDLSFSGFHECVSTVFNSENLTVLNMTGFDCSQLSPNFFKYLSGLEILVAMDIRLNIGLENDPKGILFRHQQKLTILNLADNGLTNLHPGIFAALGSVQTLNLGNNKFSSIPRSVSYMTSLTSLDMSYNAITKLSNEDLLLLDEVSRWNRSNFRLSLHGNPLYCVCSTMEFVVWLLETDIQLEQKSDLTCTLENGTKILILNLARNLSDMKVACVSRFWLTFALSATSLVFAAICVSAVCYRYRHNIRYWFLTKCRQGAGYDAVPLEDYEFDAFVAYNHEDYRWACFTLREFLEDVHGFRLCLHHRDFSVGESIQANIVDAVNSSRKIILLVSKNYITCDWGEFEIQMAGMHMVQSGRDNVVIVILLEDIPVRKMPRTLLRMWKDITFLLWTNDPGDEDAFWGRLKEAVGRK